MLKYGVWFPMVILIMGWGVQPERLVAVFYLIIYTDLASLPLLFLIFFIFNNCFSTFFPFFKMKMNFLMYSGLMGAFLVKMPLFGFHLWLLSAHVDALVSGSMILAGVLLKLGGYGIIRMLYFVSVSYKFYNLIYFVLSLSGTVMVGFCCMVQVDIKLMIAYSSVCHMGYIVGVFWPSVNEDWLGHWF